MKKDECTNAVDYETRLAIAEAISLTHHPLLKYNDNTCARCWSAAEAVMVALDLWGAPIGEIRRLGEEIERLRAVLEGFAEDGYSHDTYSAYKRHVRDTARGALGE